MRLLLTAIFLYTSFFLTAQVRPNTQSRVFDGKMVLQRCSVSVKTDGMTAITFIELEFYNSRDIEIEGLYKFQLRNGQVVSDFQLDLNGKYREGSIEEKWKASNAYNTIVGKRVDPALLTKDYDNNYSLRIYPVPAKSTRKVTMTLHEILPPETNAKQYFLPLNSSDTTGLFSFRFEALNQSIKPSFRSEWLQGTEFIVKPKGFTASADVRSIVLNKPIDVLLPSLEKQLLLVKSNADKYHFALQLKKDLSQYYSISPKSVTVFWDASASAASRDIYKEINFLKQYLLFHQTEKVTVIPFRHKPFDTVVFSVNNRTVQQLERYLSGLAHEGATGFGSLNFATVKSEVVLLFSDGYNSIGKQKPKEGNVLVYAIHAIHHSIPVDTLQLKTITGEGGAVINLYKQGMNAAIERASLAERMLLRIESANGKTILESTLPAKIDQPFIVYGTMHRPTDTLKFYYGNSQLINNIETVLLTSNIQQPSTGIDRLPMLMHYRQMIENKDWNEVLEFGLRERVVTQQTAFIVLERVEDYIRYNITPSKDLEDECRRLNYVKKDTRNIRRSLAAKTTGADLTNLVRRYNWRIKKWDATASELIYNPQQIPGTVASQQNEQQPLPGNTSLPSVQQALQGRVAGLSISNYNELSEVVVVGYGIASKKSLTGSVSIMQQQNIFQGHSNVASVLAGRVPGLQVMGNTGLPGAAPEIRIRGAVSFNGSNQPLYVVDGLPVDAETVQQVVNVNDIESITVLKDASATALYGSRGSNGVIVIQMKRGKFYNPYYYNQRKYKLSEQEDVEYIQEIKETEQNRKLAKYNELKKVHGYSAAFNMDMAEHLFSCGLNNEAFTALMNALDIIHADFLMQRTAGFILERWKQFEAAEEIFTNLLAEYSAELYLYSDLAWVYYQQGKYQQAVDLLYKGIHINFGTDENNNAGLKAMLLNDMNAMIEMHRTQLDLSAINSTLIKALPADLMIVVEDNNRGRIGLEVHEPGIHSMVVNGNPSKSGGFVATEENNPYGHYYYSGIETYTRRVAANGRYRIAVNYYAGSSYPTKIPSYVRLKVFRNFGRPNQSIQIETIAMDNQRGNIEIREIKY
jgi:TonB-dependent SusC/RagA subfamily outer membrane receptor